MPKVEIKGKGGDRQVVHDGNVVGRLVRRTTTRIVHTHDVINGKRMATGARKKTKTYWRAFGADGRYLGALPSMAAWRRHFQDLQDRGL